MGTQVNYRDCLLKSSAYQGGGAEWNLQPLVSSTTLTFVSTKRSCTGAEADCVTRGGHLASIHGKAQNDEVQALCAGEPYCWVGGTKQSVAGNPTAESAESAGWKWADGSQPSFTNFETNVAGQRVGYDDQPYTFLRPSSGEWQFEPNSYSYAYVCRAPAINADVFDGWATDLSLFGPQTTPCNLKDYQKDRLSPGDGYYYDPMSTGAGWCRTIKAMHFAAMIEAHASGAWTGQETLGKVYLPTGSPGCVPQDSDSCLQASPSWGDEYFCSQFTASHDYCTLDWMKDARRCCPVTCGTGVLTETDCNSLSGSGTCTYPNEANVKKAQMTPAHQAQMTPTPAVPAHGLSSQNRKTTETSGRHLLAFPAPTE